MSGLTALRNTPQRKLVLEIVRASTDHPTAETVYERCLQKAPEISLGTVYRNLTVLCETGEIGKVASPNGPDRYDYNVSPHFHLFCNHCKRMIDIPKEYAPSESVLKKPFECGLDVHGYALIYFGFCPECKKNNFLEESK